MPNLADYPLVATGKIRRLYDVDADHLLLVATDRLSALDHVLTPEIPDKGRVLTAMSVFYFELLADVMPNHLAAPADDPRIPAEVRGRALLVRKLTMVPFECVARGYLTGSGLVDYRRTGTVCGVALPPGLTEADQLPEPIFTPATKADLGEHDENVDFATLVDALGADTAAAIRDRTLLVYTRAGVHAKERGLILADTKFEFGYDSAGTLVLGDEVLTPDSSRYWPVDGYTPGRVQPSFDKQPVRDWLSSPTSGWDRDGSNPPPALPPEVVTATRDRYVEAYERITGLDFADWLNS